MDELKKKLLKKALKSIEYHDTGKDWGTLSNPVEKEKYYPVISLDASTAPFLEDFEVGDICSFVIKGKVVGRDISGGAIDKRDEYRLEIRGVGKLK